MSRRVGMDGADLRILGALQQDAMLSVAALSERVHLSHNSCWRRLKRLEEAGVIARRVTLLNPQRLGLRLTAYMSVRTSEHSEQWLAGFARAVAAIPAITELYRMTGDVDYLLKLHVASMADYDAVYRKLIALVKLTDVSTAFVMEEIKHTTELPLAVHAPEEG